jgi:NADH-quinone oxidoreductase subunit L
VGFPGQLFHVSGLNLIDRFLEPVILPLGGAAAHGTEAVAEHGSQGLTLGVEWLLVLGSVAVAVAGIVIARRFYLGPEAFNAPQRLAQRLPFFHKLLLNKYWIDEIYGAVVIAPIRQFAVFCWQVVDNLIIDTLFINGSAFAVELTGDLLRFTTTGNVRNYAMTVALAVLALAVLLW